MENFLVFALLFLAWPDQDAEKKAHATYTGVALGQVTEHKVIRTAQELADWRKSTPEQAAAEWAKLLKIAKLDMDRHMLILVAGGRQRTGGFRIEAKRLLAKDDGLEVHWILHAPDPNDFVTQAISYPALLLLVDQVPGKVRFVK